MFGFRTLDDTDPIERAYRRYLHRLKVLIVILLVVGAVAYAVGLPHVQWTYTYTGHRPPDGVVRAYQKLDAWYVGFSGWHHVRRGQYGHDGCPFILFIPIEDCLQR